jgi:hypothetical protein
MHSCRLACHDSGNYITPPPIGLSAAGASKQVLLAQSNLSQISVVTTLLRRAKTDECGHIQISAAPSSLAEISDLAITQNRSLNDSLAKGGVGGDRSKQFRT